jgi:DNA helicase IV
MLAESLRRRNPGLAANIVTIDRFLLSLAGRQGQDALPREASQKTVFFRETLPALAIDVASSFSPAEKYDALIVDEGQDFSELQLVALLEVLTPSDSSYVFFADWEQDVYSAASLGAIGVDVLFTLQHNCRNTVCINDTSNRLTARRVPSMPGVPAGTKPLVLRRSGAGAVATEAWVTARSWYNGPGSVAILSPFKLENSSMAASLKGHGLSLVTSLDEWDTPDTVYFSTIKSFKGIEAPTVIVVDVNLPDASPSFRREDAYVACTRATTRLALITSNDVAAKWMEQELSDGAPALSVPPRRV